MGYPSDDVFRESMTNRAPPVSGGWTPEQLRTKTLKANGGFANKAAAEASERAERRFQDALMFFEKNASEASDKGLDSAEALEAESDKRTFDELDEETKALFDRLRPHFERRGFRTKIHGPYSGGGPSHAFCGGFDLVVMWG
jgi:hypothetical protein